MIDPHVHFRDWEQSEKETVAHGLYVASKAGFTHVFDMPNCSPPLTDGDTVMKRLELSHNPSYHIYAGLTSDPVQIENVVSAYNCFHPRVVGLKLFAGQSTGNMGVTEKSEQLTVFRTLESLGYTGVVAVHCEKQSLMQPELYISGRFDTHSLARPAEAEYESVKDILSAASDSGFVGTVHIAHASCGKTVEYVKEFRNKGLSVTMGVTPHHALFTTEDARNHSQFLKMNPPLRNESDRKAVFDSLLDGTASWIESDHAPHTLEDKEKGASGIPGFSGMLFLIEALRKAGCSETHLQDLLCNNAANVFGISVTDRDRVIPVYSEKLIEEIQSEYPTSPIYNL